jgi:hypothetical protein
VIGGLAVDLSQDMSASVARAHGLVGHHRALRRPGRHVPRRHGVLQRQVSRVGLVHVAGGRHCRPGPADCRWHAERGAIIQRITPQGDVPELAALAMCFQPRLQIVGTAEIQQRFPELFESFWGQRFNPQFRLAIQRAQPFAQLTQD